MEHYIYLENLLLSGEAKLNIWFSTASKMFIVDIISEGELLCRTSGSQLDSSLLKYIDMEIREEGATAGSNPYV